MNKFVVVAAVSLLGMTLPGYAQKDNYPAGTKLAPYPRINTTIWYEVDPTWPQKPANVDWGQVPGVAVDKQDNVWIYTRTNLTVQVFAPDGHFLKGWQATSTNSIAHFIRLDSAGYVWMADVGLHIVTKRHPDDGRVLLTLGTPGESGCDKAHLFKPTDIAFGPKGDIYVADGYGNARVVHYDKEGKYINAWGELGTAPGKFSIPHSVVCDSKGRVYVADRNNVRVQVFDKQGGLLEVWPDLMVPWGLWMSPKDEIWACGSSPMIWTFDPKYPLAPLGCPPKDQLIMRFNTSGKLLQLWTFPKNADGEEKPGTCNWLHGFALDSKGNAYCTDIIGRRLQKFIRKTDPQFHR